MIIEPAIVVYTSVFQAQVNFVKNLTKVKYLYLKNIGRFQILASGGLNVPLVKPLLTNDL